MRLFFAQKKITALMFALIMLTATFSVVVFAEQEFFAGSTENIDPTAGQLMMYDADRGLFELPYSANEIPVEATPIARPTITFEDTIVLSDESSEPRGLVIYRVSDGMLFVNTFVGAGNGSVHSAAYFGEGEFAIVMTSVPDQCANLNLTECRESAGFMHEKNFSISENGEPMFVSVPDSIITVIEDAMPASVIEAFDAPEEEIIVPEIPIEVPVEIPDKSVEVLPAAENNPEIIVAPDPVIEGVEEDIVDIEGESSTTTTDEIFISAPLDDTDISTTTTTTF